MNRGTIWVFNLTHIHAVKPPTVSHSYSVSNESCIFNLHVKPLYLWCSDHEESHPNRRHIPIAVCECIYTILLIRDDIIWSISFQSHKLCMQHACMVTAQGTSAHINKAGLLLTSHLNAYNNRDISTVQVPKQQNMNGKDSQKMYQNQCYFV